MSKDFNMSIYLYDEHEKNIFIKENLFRCPAKVNVMKVRTNDSVYSLLLVKNQFEHECLPSGLEVKISMQMEMMMKNVFNVLAKRVLEKEVVRKLDLVLKNSSRSFPKYTSELSGMLNAHQKRQNNNKLPPKSPYKCPNQIVPMKNNIKEPVCMPLNKGCRLKSNSDLPIMIVKSKSKSRSKSPKPLVINYTKPKPMDIVKLCQPKPMLQMEKCPSDIGMNKDKPSPQTDLPYKNFEEEKKNRPYDQKVFSKHHKPDLIPIEKKSSSKKIDVSLNQSLISPYKINLQSPSNIKSNFRSVSSPKNQDKRDNSDPVRRKSIIIPARKILNSPIPESKIIEISESPSNIINIRKHSPDTNNNKFLLDQSNTNLPVITEAYEEYTFSLRNSLSFKNLSMRQKLPPKIIESPTKDVTLYRENTKPINSEHSTYLKQTVNNFDQNQEKTQLSFLSSPKSIMIRNENYKNLHKANQNSFISIQAQLPKYYSPEGKNFFFPNYRQENNKYITSDEATKKSKLFTDYDNIEEGYRGVNDCLECIRYQVKCNYMLPCGCYNCLKCLKKVVENNQCPKCNRKFFVAEIENLIVKK